MAAKKHHKGLSKNPLLESEALRGLSVLKAANRREEAS
jgi:hypothetical protein